MKETQLIQILEEKQIKSVYQPIVSLEDGSVFGYEALARITLEDCLFSVEEMFILAEKCGKLWELEYLCRKKALKGSTHKLGDKKLFLNVDPYIINDERFQAGMTQKYLDRYSISSENIIFEITERTDIDIDDISIFQNVIKHYKKEGYQIAIDDFGKEYSGIQRILKLSPRYVKIDMDLVHNIHLDSVRCQMLESIVKFCNPLGIKLIAEGIETKEELAKLIRLGIHYGQGYYLARPNEVLKKPEDETVRFIRSEHLLTKECKLIPSFFGEIHSISCKKETTQCNTSAIAIYEFLKANPDVEELCVLDEEEHVQGLVTRYDVFERFGGQYGYNLTKKKQVKDILSKEFLAVDWKMSIEMVSKMAMVRPKKHLYDIVIVLKEDQYYGTVTVKDLLEAAISIQIERATDANPLTQLPGNKRIQEEIEKKLTSQENYSIMYLDLDNFKAYNDVYGFENGDLMIQAVADSMKISCESGEFLGHIGGDDFVIIASHYDMKEKYEKIIQRFHECLKQLYTPEDYKKGEIVSRNRNGLIENFPLVTISAAMITNEVSRITNIDDFSKKIATVKKMSKHTKGDSLVEYS
ncbi:MAG: GGDEF domain-containing protein [Roseburia sp.]